MTVRFLVPASTGLDEAVAYDDAQQQGLGQRFAMAVQDSVARIVRYPESYQRIGTYSRRCIVSGFPYGVIYQLRRTRRIFWWLRWRIFIAGPITGSRVNHEARRGVDDDR